MLVKILCKKRIGLTPAGDWRLCSPEDAARFVAMKAAVIVEEKQPEKPAAPQSQPHKRK